MIIKADDLLFSCVPVVFSSKNSSSVILPSISLYAKKYVCFPSFLYLVNFMYMYVHLIIFTPHYPLSPFSQQVHFVLSCLLFCCGCDPLSFIGVAYIAWDVGQNLPVEHPEECLPLPQHSFTLYWQLLTERWGTHLKDNGMLESLHIVFSQGLSNLCIRPSLAMALWKDNMAFY